MTYIGIDPGKSGALAIIESDGTVSTFLFDKEAYLRELLRVDETDAICCLEHVNSLPHDGHNVSFNFGENFGWIQGILDAYKIPYELVRPQKWKKEFSITKDKNMSIAVCKRLFPNVSLLPTPRCRKDNDGLAEAILMAEFARRKLGR